MQGLDATVEPGPDPGQLLGRPGLDARRGEVASGPLGGDDLDAALGEWSNEVRKTRRVENGTQRPSDGAVGLARNPHYPLPCPTNREPK